MPTRLAARKWPSSWTNTSTPSTNTNARSVDHATEPQTFNSTPRADLLRILAGPLVDSANRAKRRHLGRAMRVHRPLDDLRQST